MFIKTWIYRCRIFGLSIHSAILILALNLFATFFEALGIAIFLPIFQFISANGDLVALASESKFWGLLVPAFERAGLEVNLGLLLSVAFVLLFARQLALYLRIMYYFNTLELTVRGLRNRCLKLYLEAGTCYQERMPVGHLVNVFTTEAREAVVALLVPVLFLSTCLVILVYLSILGGLSFVMTSAALVAIGAAIFTTKHWLSESAHTGRSLTAANTRTSTFLVSRLESPRLVRLARTETAEMAEFSLLTERQCNEGIRLGSVQARADLVLEPIVIAISCLFLYGAVSLFDMPIEEIGLYLVVAVRLLPVARELMRQWQGIKRGLGPIEIVEDRMTQMAYAKEKSSGVRTLDSLVHGIEFQNVSFRYSDAGEYVLEDVSLKIPAMKMTALVGPSGSGKSTLIDLLPRLREASAGKIILDGIDIYTYDLDSLRGQIAYAPQSPQIFSGSISDHIKYGNPNATFDEIVEAAVMAGAHSFVANLKEGYHTRIGDGGYDLSGGQRQRLDIARVFLSRATLVIMDEPTSNLDVESELIFRDGLNIIRDKSNRTLIVIAHNLTNISNADKIVVIMDGKIKASGTHEELMGVDGWYKNAFNSQNFPTDPAC